MRTSAWLESLNAVAPVFVDAALRGAVVLLAALAITHMMRRRTAAARHLVWVGAMVIQLALPVFAMWGPQWRIALPDPVANVMPVDLHETPAADVVNVDVTPRRTAREVVTAAPTTQLRGTDAPAADEAIRISGKSLLVVLWLAGVAFILARLAIGTSIVASLARKVSAESSNAKKLATNQKQKSHDNTQYLATVGTVGADTTHYLFAHLDQDLLSFTSRLDVTLNPTLSLQMYAEPFVTAGHYTSIRQLGAARSATYDARFAAYGGATPLGDFNDKSFNASAVLRWEYRPASRLFVVWTQARSQGDLDTGDFAARRDYQNLFAARPDNVFLVKAVYWLGR